MSNIGAWMIGLYIPTHCSQSLGVKGWEFRVWCPIPPVATSSCVVVLTMQRQWSSWVAATTMLPSWLLMSLFLLRLLLLLVESWSWSWRLRWWQWWETIATSLRVIAFRRVRGSRCFAQIQELCPARVFLQTCRVECCDYPTTAGSSMCTHAQCVYTCTHPCW